MGRNILRKRGARLLSFGQLDYLEMTRQELKNKYAIEDVITMGKSWMETIIDDVWNNAQLEFIKNLSSVEIKFNNGGDKT